MALFPLGILSAAGGGAAAGDYELIQTQIISGSSTTSVVFSNLNNFSSTYKHLQIRASVSHTGSGGNAMDLRINGDTGSNYAWHQLFGGGSSVISSGLASQTLIRDAIVFGQNNSNTSFSGAVIDILDCYSTTKNKTIRSLGGMPATNSIIQLGSGVRLNTEAVSSINLFIQANALGANSRLSLYGIRG
jgi:hypothetical protein